MRTQIMPEQALGLPWLEHFPTKGGPPEKTLIDKSPFLIGRGESADLQVDSQGVSREHAAVERDGQAIRIRDLGSTNGTFVNGQRIKDADLNDGDMVQVANFEFAFYCGKPPSRRAAVTQVLAAESDAERGPFHDPKENGALAPFNAQRELRRAVRSLHETLVSGCVQCRLQPIVGLGNGQLAGYQPAACPEYQDIWNKRTDRGDWPAANQGELLPQPIPGRAAARLRQLRRMRGVEQAVAMPGEFFILVDFQPAEVAAGRLPELAGMLCELLPDPNRLVIGVPYSVAEETVQALAPGGRLRELGVAVAVSGFAGGDAGTALLAELGPDFVTVAASLVRGIPDKSMSSRAITAMFRAIRGSGTKVIATGVSSPAECAACLEAGCELGQGGLFEEQKRAALRAATIGGPSAAVDAFFLSQTANEIACT